MVEVVLGCDNNLSFFFYSNIYHSNDKRLDEFLHISHGKKTLKQLTVFFNNWNFSLKFTKYLANLEFLFLSSILYLIYILLSKLLFFTTHLFKICCPHLALLLLHYIYLKTKYPVKKCADLLKTMLLNQRKLNLVQSLGLGLVQRPTLDQVRCSTWDWHTIGNFASWILDLTD